MKLHGPLPERLRCLSTTNKRLVQGLLLNVMTTRHDGERLLMRHLRPGRSQGAMTRSGQPEAAISPDMESSKSRK